MTTKPGTKTRPIIDGRYGDAPVPIGEDRSLGALVEWTEFMHVLYLPVRIPHNDEGLRAVPSTFRDGVTLPKNLAFMAEPVAAALADARQLAPHLVDPYVYVTARRGFATPGNPLNREGWHCDDFGGTDLNYIWTDRWPTRFLLSDVPYAISADDATSMGEFERMARAAAERRGSYTIASNLRIEDGPVNTLLRLTPYVIHATPLIPEPGGMRSFFKISVSTERYDLLGNSHNHELNYEWEMTRRAITRNKPQSGSTP